MFPKLWRTVGVCVIVRRMEDFPALIHSIGEHAVSYIGRQNLAALSVAGDRVNGSAHIEIVLQDNSWTQQSRAIDKMIELRAMFMDEISLSYSFSGADVVDVPADAEHESTYCFA